MSVAGTLQGMPHGGKWCGAADQIGADNALVEEDDGLLFGGEEL